MADIKFDVILGMHFLKIINADILFSEKTLMQKFYIINKALATIKQVKIDYPKEFMIAALDADNKRFIMHVTIQE